MIKLRLKESGGYIFVYSENEKPIDGELCISSEEWEWAKKLAKNVSDPEAEKEFMKTVIQKKKDNPGYNLFEDFPRDPISVADKVCSEVIQMLQRGIPKEEESA